MLNRFKMPQEIQDYKYGLANDLNILRMYGAVWKDLARILLDREKKDFHFSKKCEELNKLIREELAKWNFDYVVENSDKYSPNLDSETAYMLYETWHGERVRDNIRRFYLLDVRVFDKVIYPHFENKSKSDYSDKIDYFEFNNFCRRNIKRFENQSDIVIYLIDHGVSPEKILKNFHWLNKTAAKKIWYRCLLSQSYKNDLFDDYDEKKLKYIFKWLDEEALWEMLSEVTPSNAYNLKNIIQWFILDKKAFHCIRNKYLECQKLGYYADVDYNYIKEAIIKNIELFKWLDVEDAKLLIENGYKDIVINHPEHFWLKKEK